MQVIFSFGEATAKQIVEQLPDPPSRTAVRTLLTILVEKGLLKYKRVGREFVYSPKGSREKAKRGALKSVLDTFFGGSLEDLIASHFADPKSNIDDETLERIAKMIEEAREDDHE